MRFKTFLTVALIALFAFSASGCGDSEDEGINTTDNNPAQSEAEDPNGEMTESSGSGTKLALAANPDGELKYNKTKLNTKPGNVTIALTNESSTPHDVAVRDSSDTEIGKSETITDSETSLVLPDLGAGSYTFFCTLPGHEAAGMKGTLTVR
ncbi:MAG: plastocyanin/azurin family copper-binding protein [Solirubrobacterales bacterium]